MQRNPEKRHRLRIKNSNKRNAPRLDSSAPFAQA